MRGGRARGAALTVTSALAFALSSIFARIAYDSGSNAVTVGASRMLLSAGAIAVALVATRQRFALPGGRAGAPLGLGLLLAGYSWALLAAIERMPVALAVLAFYTFPLLIVLAALVEGRERIGPARAAAIGAAFLGLAIALGGGGGALDGFGLILALAAAAGNAAMIVATRGTPQAERQRLTMFILCTAGLILLVAGALAGAIRPPLTAGGWLALAGASACYAVAMTSMFAAIGLIGPVQVGAVFNVEPVASLVFSLILLGHRPSTLQVIGMAVVVCALVAVQLWGAREPERP